MSATAEAVTEATKKAAKKAVKKTPAKKAAPKKVAAKKAAKAAPKKRVAKKAAAPKTASAKRGRPAGKKTGVRRGKKGAKQYAYLLLTTQEDGTQKASAMNGPFASENDALDDASLMSDEKADITVVVFRESKRGRVQRQTKFVAGR